MDEVQSFQQVQQRFTEVMRDAAVSWQGNAYEQERVALYQSLIFNSIEEAVRQCFPIITSIMAEDEWEDLVKDFIKNHQSKTPLFHRLAEEFVDYLLNERNTDEQKPYLAELAHYEWVELAVECLDASIDAYQVTDEEDLKTQSLRLSPLAMVSHYSYEVDKIGPKWQPTITDQVPTLIIIYRCLADDVHFMKINPITLQLLEYIAQFNTPQIALEKLSATVSMDSRADLIAFGYQTIGQLCQQSILIRCE